MMSREGTFDANGVATVEFRNGGLSRWDVELLSVNTSSTVRTRATVYRGAPSQLNYSDSTRDGNNKTSDTKMPVNVGDFITVQWTGGTPGAVAVARIEGKDILKGRRIY
jgi:hypothetical protein